MAKPGTVRQTLGYQQSTLGAAERLIQPGAISGRILLLRKNLCSRLLKVPRSRCHRVEVESAIAEFVLCSFSCNVEISGNLFAILLVVVRQHVGIGHAQGL